MRIPVPPWWVEYCKCKQDRGWVWREFGLPVTMPHLPITISGRMVPPLWVCAYCGRPNEATYRYQYRMYLERRNLLDDGKKVARKPKRLRKKR